MKKLTFTTLLFIMWIPATVNAALLSVSEAGPSSAGGNAEILTMAPGSVVDDNPGQENTAQQGFDERQNVLLTQLLEVDGGSISAGTSVSSHMIFLNSDGRQRITHHNVDWVFDGLILGVISQRNGNREDISNYLGHPDTIYPGSFRNRGFERRDSYELLNDNTLRVNMRVREPGDWIRVITAVPEPATLGLFCMSLLGLGLRRRK